MNRGPMLMLILGCATVAATATAAEIALPPENTQLIESPLHGYALAQALCLTCHSPDYIAYQPPSGPAYWRAAVLKMQKVFAAPIPDEAIDPIVEYLIATYGKGRERPATNADGNRPVNSGGTRK